MVNDCVSVYLHYLNGYTTMVGEMRSLSFFMSIQILKNRQLVVLHKLRRILSKRFYNLSFINKRFYNLSCINF